MDIKSVYVFVFVNQLFYGKVKWPAEGVHSLKPFALRIRLIDDNGKVGFLGKCKPEYLTGYGSTSVTEGRMYVMSLGIKAEYTLIDDITPDYQKGDLCITIRKEK